MNRLTESIVAVCREQLLKEKWLVAPSRRVGYQWLDQVVRQGQPAVNVHVKTLVLLALELAAPTLTQRDVALVSPRGNMLLVDQVIRSLADGELDYLAQAQPSVGLAETVLASIDSLRLAGLSAADLDRAGFEVAGKGDDVEVILRSYLDLLEQENLVDYASVLQTAIDQLQAGSPRLGENVLVLVPEETELAALERQLLESLPAGQHLSLPVDPLALAGKGAEPVSTDLELCRWLTNLNDAPPPLQDDTVQLFCAVGEVNEVRGVLRRCLQQELPWDEVELLHCDTDCYVSLVYETFSSLARTDVEIGDELPVTFAEGIACRYSRPGRALLGWIQWITADWGQQELVKTVKQGLLRIDDVGSDDLDFSRLGKEITDLGLVFGRKQFVPRIVGRIASLQRRLEELGTADEDLASRVNLQRRLCDLEQLKTLVTTLLEVTPAVDAGQREVVSAARRFLELLARCVSRLDHFAVQKLIEELDDMAHWLERCGDESAIDVWEWLRLLPAETRVMGSVPQPGCLHVDSIYRGGHSGRPTTLIVGLDDRRFPGSGAQDPLLLDSERLALSDALPTASQRREECLRDFARLLARLRGQLLVSFSSQAVTGEGETFPSPVLLTLHRLVTGNPESDQQALLKDLTPAESFAPSDEEACLDQAEWWMWRLTENNRISNLEDLLEHQFTHLVDGRRAREHWASSRFTAYDGLVPAAGMALDPTVPGGPVMSANGFQRIGQCPRAFFFKYGLRLALPDDGVVDPESWLDHLTSGLLLHELFEGFVRELVEEERFPELKRDRERLLQLLEEQVTRYRDRYPPPDEITFQQERDVIEQTALTFLREDELFCREHGCRPLFLEASFGMEPSGSGTSLDISEPVPITLAGGKQVSLRGRVDRIDRIGDAALKNYAVWDYKTGSAFGFEKAVPFQQGRKVQSYLYVMMVGHAIRKEIDPSGTVKHFGFFFPGPRTIGQRIKWTPKELADGKDVLGHLCQVVADGAFLATDDPNDCKFCDYRSICGNQVFEISACKLADPENELLEPIRQLRARPAT